MLDKIKKECLISENEYVKDFFFTSSFDCYDRYSNLIQVKIEPNLGQKCNGLNEGDITT